MAHQLAKSSSSLSQTFYTSPCPLFKLTEGILSDIFMIFVFENTKAEAGWPLCAPFPGTDTRIIYRRLYDLLAVCRTWRYVVLARGALWSVISMIMDPFEFPDEHHPFQLALQRTRECKLHLDLTIARPTSAPANPVFMPVLVEYGYRFSTLNIKVDHLNVARAAIEILLKTVAPGTLSGLSLQVSNATHLSRGVPIRDDYLVFRSPLNESFTTLLERLSVFRVCGTNIYWETMTFSTRLVEVHIENITLGYDDAIIPLLQALSSAPELRELKIISVATLRNSSMILDMNAFSPVTFPSLRSLFLIGLYYNTLELLLPMISPSAHQVSILLGHKSLTIHERRRFLGGEVRLQDVEVQTPNNLCRLLEDTRVDALTVFGSHWLNGHMLQSLLRVIPALKTLNVNSCVFNSGNCSKLERLSDAEMQPQDHPNPLPALETLRMTRCIIDIEAFEDFKKMVASHPLKQVMVGMIVRHVNPTGGYIWEPLREDSDLVNWLRATVPVVHVIDHEPNPPEDYRVRGLW